MAMVWIGFVSIAILLARHYKQVFLIIIIVIIIQFDYLFIFKGLGFEYFMWR